MLFTPIGIVSISESTQFNFIRGVTMKVKRIIKTLFSGKTKVHFGQYGEDIIIHKFFHRKKTDGVYVDIGAFHPFYLSNTAYLWLKGWSGINVDANPNSIKQFERVRSSDVNIFGAVVPSETAKNDSSIAIYIPDNNTINAMGTCDTRLAEERSFSNKINVPTISVSDIFNQLKGKEIDFLNIDIEGLDEVVLDEIDFNSHQPKVICIEDYSSNLSELLNSVITTKLTSVGYSLKARVGPSSIFFRN